MRFFFIICLLWSWSFQQAHGQVLADFTFDDTSDMPASLKINTVGVDALNINPNARSDGEGVYTLNNTINEDQNINLEIPEALLNQTKSIYLEFDFRPQENFCWLIFSGYIPGLNLFRFGYADYPNQPNQQGFHVRYVTKADTISGPIESGYVGGALPRGERALIGFMYDAESGTAYIFKNGNIIWQTPDAEKSPGFGFHWQTAAGYLTVGANMNGNGSTTPSLYRFRAFENACTPFVPLTTQGDTVCGQASATLEASGADNGQYRWYSGEEDNLTLINGEFNSTYTTPNLKQTTTYYVSVMGEFCESEPVPVEAVVQPEPRQPKIYFTPACGIGELTLYLEEQQEDMDYFWSSADGSQIIKQSDSINLNITQDTLVTVWAGNGICESDRLQVNIPWQGFPTIDAGPDHSILTGESTELLASGDFLQCQWSGGSLAEGTNTSSITVSPKFTQSYVVTAFNDAGCQQSDTVTVFVINRFPVPNAFSPNRDGLNDTWEIPNIDKYPHCKIAVFNRWGNEVFSSAGYWEAWDGTQNGQPLPFGTYYYSLQLSPDHKAIKGTVSTIR